MNLKFIFRAIRPFMGDIDVKIDRARQIITFRNNGQTETMNVDQLFDEIETLFHKSPIMANDGCKAPETPQTTYSLRSWLAKCDKPLTDPLK